MSYTNYYRIAQAAGLAYGLLYDKTGKKKNTTALANSTMPVKRSRSMSRRKPLKYRAFKAKKTSSAKKRAAYRKSKRQSTFAKTRKLAKRVNTISRQLKAGEARHTHRQSTASRIVTAEGFMEHAFLNIDAADIETAAAGLRYYDPSVPGTLVTAAAGTGTYSRQLYVKQLSYAIEIKNNYHAPALVKVYLCKPKTDTSDSPVTLYEASIDDQIVGADGNEDNTTLLFPGDMRLLNKIWDLKVLKNRVLQPGQTIRCANYEGNFTYNPSVSDTQTDTWTKNARAFGFLVRVEGCPGHDTTLDQQNITQAGVDILGVKTYKFIYDAGVSLDDISYSDNRDTITADCYFSARPQAAQQLYKVS